MGLGKQVNDKYSLYSDGVMGARSGPEISPWKTRLKLEQQRLNQPGPRETFPRLGCWKYQVIKTKSGRRRWDVQSRQVGRANLPAKREDGGALEYSLASLTVARVFYLGQRERLGYGG